MTDVNQLDARGADTVEKPLEGEAEIMSDECFEPHDIEAIRLEITSEPLYEMESSLAEDERELYRYLKRRQRAAMQMIAMEDQVKKMLKRMKNEIEGLDFVYKPRAEQIARRLLANEKKRKSVQTPFGTVGFRLIGGGFQIEDDKRLIAAVDAAKAEDPIKECVTREPKINKTLLNAYIKTSGELPPGVKLGQAINDFYVK